MPRLPLCRSLLIAGLLVLIPGTWQLGAAGWIHAKAWLAQDLLERAWVTTLAADPQTAIRPWPWADTYPLARLQAPGLDIDQVVLAGASGRSLAFGPGHLDGTAAPGTEGHSVVVGHRDTHFAFLRDLAPGDPLRLQGPDGLWRDYRIETAEVIDARAARLAPDDGRAALTLVTCYPFDTVEPGGPLRYLVFAVAEETVGDLAPKRVVSTMPATMKGTPTR